MTSSDDDGQAGRGAAPAADSAAPVRPHARRMARFVPSRHRPWWKWALIFVLLLFSLAVTVLYATVLAGDVAQHHWTDALDASRDAVPAIVGWAALLIVFCTGGTTAAERMLSVDNLARNEKQKQAAQAEESVRGAEQRVAKLTARLAELTAARAAAGPGMARGLDRQLAHTSARLDKAQQWLAGATSALESARQDAAEAGQKLARDFPDPAGQPGPRTSKPA